MSLDVYLKSPDGDVITRSGSGIFIRESGAVREITRGEWDERFPGRDPVIVNYQTDYTDELYSANITHNLAKMAKDAGLYEYLWHPEEIGVATAAQLIQPLRAGLALLEETPDRFRASDPGNGWGNYGGLVSFVRDYVEACEAYPSAIVEVSR